MFGKKDEQAPESAEETPTPEETPTETETVAETPAPTIKVGKEAATVPIHCTADLKFRVGEEWVEIPKGRSKVTKQVYEILLARNVLVAT